MPQFRYRAVTHAGEIVVGEVDASSCEEVVRRIEYLGHLTIAAEIAATGILNRGRGSIGKLPRSRDVSIFLRQLPYRVTASVAWGSDQVITAETIRLGRPEPMQNRQARVGCDGFTLVEVLAALAIASVIIMASAALIHNVALFFDRGTRAVTEAERLMLAVERLAGDFGSARFVWRRTEDGAAAAFAAERASSGAPASIIFVGAGRAVSNPSVDDDLISLTIEEEGEVRRLVRRRATWPGPRVRFEDVTPEDPVVLIEGRFDISFVFGRVTPDGALAWYASWAGERVLPNYVRLMLRDRVTGADLLGEADFVVRANAPAACGRADAGVACLTAAAPAQTDTFRTKRGTR